MIKLKNYKYNPTRYELTSISPCDSGFTKIQSPHKTFYGGDQNWFDFKYGREKACGTVAASNLLAHLSLQAKSHRRLYPYEDFSKESYGKFMEDVYRYMRPKPWGILSLREFENGVLNYAGSKAIKISSKKTRPFLSPSRREDFLVAALMDNHPIAMLQYFRGSGFNFHWTTITEHIVDKRDGSKYLGLSSWGNKYIFPLEEVIANKMIYFKFFEE